MSIQTPVIYTIRKNLIFVDNYYLILGSADQTIWQLQGAQGNSWQQAQAPISSGTKSYQVVFEGHRGRSYTGDIAIDDISFTSSTCGGRVEQFRSKIIVKIRNFAKNSEVFCNFHVLNV